LARILCALPISHPRGGVGDLALSRYQNKPTLRLCCPGGAACLSSAGDGFLLDLLSLCLTFSPGFLGWVAALYQTPLPCLAFPRSALCNWKMQNAHANWGAPPHPLLSQSFFLDQTCAGCLRIFLLVCTLPFETLFLSCY